MRVRIGLIGAGRMGNVHATCLKEIPQAHIVAVADIVPARAHALAALWNASAYTDYRALLDREQLDAVYICTPTNVHAEPACAVAERGLPFFIEKPLALTMREAQHIARAVEQNKMLTCVGYHWRYTNAAPSIYRVVEDSVDPLSRAEALIALGSMRATEYADASADAWRQLLAFIRTGRVEGSSQ